MFASDGASNIRNLKFLYSMNDGGFTGRFGTFDLLEFI